MKHDPEGLEAALAAFQPPEAPLSMPPQQLERPRRRRRLLRLAMRSLFAFARS